MRTGILVASAAALLVGCANTASTDGPYVANPPPTAAGLTPATSAPLVPVAADGEVHSAAEAKARAAADLAAVRLPAGAVLQQQAPSPQLTAPPMTTAGDTLVDAVRWWTVPGTVADVTAFVKAHSPYGLSVGGTSGGSNHVSSVSFRGLAQGRDNGHNEIDVSLVQGSGSVGVRLESQVIWLPPKNAHDVLTPDLSTATLTYTPPSGKAQPPVDVSARQLKALATAIDKLEVLPPGPPWSCPMDQGERAVLTVTTAEHQQSFDIALQGCGFVTVTYDGTTGHTLTGAEALDNLVRDDLGVQVAPSSAPGASG